MKAATLIFLAAGSATFPLTIFAVAAAARLLGFQRSGDPWVERALTISFIVWLLGAMIFYWVSLYEDHKSTCRDQRTTQLTYECRKFFRLE